MAFADLREFMALLEKRGKLARISAPVSPELEITEITDRVSKAGGPALLFDNVRGYEMPVAINLFGSEDRMSWALGVNTLDELGARIQRWLD
ncbi:MAG: menaquinone biosynthesis decarboxylase, partial [Ktedonobacterales bacterium]